MATLKSTITIDSSDFFSTKLDVSTSNSTVTTGDDRAFSVERVAAGTRAYSTITQTADSVSWMNNKTMLFTDAQQNQHTITFSQEHSNSSIGNAGTGSITVTGATVSAYNTLTLILIDNAAAPRTLTITFNNTTTTTVRGVSTSTAIVYAVGMSGVADTATAIRTRIITALTTIRTAGDISITASAEPSSTVLINLTQDLVGGTGDTTISGTVTSRLTLTSFTTGGDAYTSTYAGISNNGTTTTAHLTSLRNSLLLAINEGLLNMVVDGIPTASTLKVWMTGPYAADSGITITGTAITTASTTAATVFAGARVPEVLPVGEFNSQYQRVYLYASNKSSSPIDFYIKESTTKASGTVTASKADTTDLNVGGTLSLISSKNNTYVITIVAVGAATANTRTGDLTADVEDSAVSDVFMTNLIETISLLDNEAGNEARPFSATVDGAGLVLTIEPTDIDSGTAGNTTITQNYSGGSLTVADVDFAGGLDTFHHIMRIGGYEHCFVPLAGNPSLYCDAQQGGAELEYLTLEA